jgi:pyridoxine 5-phosphate synthase
VPEKRQELTTEGGLDVVAHRAVVKDAVNRLKDAGIIVSLFIDPDAKQLDESKALGAHAIEFQTASYSEAKGDKAIALELDKLHKASAYAQTLGLHIHMGHGLNYTNVQAVCKIPGVEELNIGHSIVSRAVLVGLDRAVRDMKLAMQV